MRLSQISADLLIGRAGGLRPRPVLSATRASGDKWDALRCAVEQCSHPALENGRFNSHPYQIGRAGGIRTRGLFVPNEALYQAEPQPVFEGTSE
jgi:hypothetical protein